jgi:hypothetical protein
MILAALNPIYTCRVRRVAVSTFREVAEEHGRAHVLLEVKQSLRPRLSEGSEWRLSIPPRIWALPLIALEACKRTSELLQESTLLAVRCFRGMHAPSSNPVESSSTKATRPVALSRRKLLSKRSSSVRPLRGMHRAYLNVIMCPMSDARARTKPCRPLTLPDSVSAPRC